MAEENLLTGLNLNDICALDIVLGVLRVLQDCAFMCMGCSSVIIYSQILNGHKRPKISDLEKKRL